MLHAQICKGSSSWIVSLVAGTDEICILRVCATEAEALGQRDAINSLIIPKQKSVVERLENTQKLLKEILNELGPLPVTSQELILAVRKVIKYVEEGKSRDII